ncbi:MAG: CBS domain-containing protein [Thermotoga sp.]|nr:CBS domain-containing protein [Thermotogota bacterium]RKX55773.1 MAG: CBS domain-containing protein [Thermotoga sp.]
MKVKDIMTRDVTSVGLNDILERVVETCAHHNREGVPIVDDENRVVGFVSAKDIMSAALPGYLEMLQSTSFIPDTDTLFKKLTAIRGNSLKDVLKPKKVIKVNGDDTALYAADLIIKNGINSLVVVDEQDRLVGIVSRVALLLALLKGNDRSKESE